MPGATSAVMEMCIDNPREGFGELFDTHPTVEARVAALVKFAGGHDPGPIALPPQGGEEAAAGPWGSPESAPDGGFRRRGAVPIRDNRRRPPGPWSEPPAEPSSAPSSESTPGPWDPRRGE